MPAGAGVAHVHTIEVDGARLRGRNGELAGDGGAANLVEGLLQALGEVGRGGEQDGARGASGHGQAIHLRLRSCHLVGREDADHVGGDRGCAHDRRAQVGGDGPDVVHVTATGQTVAHQDQRDLAAGVGRQVGPQVGEHAAHGRAHRRVAYRESC